MSDAQYQQRRATLSVRKMTRRTLMKINLTIYKVLSSRTNYIDYTYSSLTAHDRTGAKVDLRHFVLSLI